MGTADEWGELQVLMPEFGEFDTSPPTLELVSKDGALHRSEGVNAVVLPHVMQRLEPRRAELSSGCRDVEGRVPCWAHGLTPPCPEVPVELFGVVRGQRHQEGVPNGVPIKRRPLAESAREEDTNGPFVDRLEQRRVPQEEHPKVGGHLAGRQRPSEAPLRWRLFGSPMAS